MRKEESPLSALNAYLPRGAFALVEKYLVTHKVHLTITRERSTVLGNYQGGYRGKNHRISVNGNLNKYAFLITLLHEFGHLLAFEKFGTRIIAHGTEWKKEYGKVLASFISNKIFPRDIEAELLSTLKNPAATSCAETSLLRILRKYDPEKPGFYLLEELAENSFFRIKNGSIFCKGIKKRTRFLCWEAGTKKLYMFSPVIEVEHVTGKKYVTAALAVNAKKRKR